ncbi:insulin-degrading enzyme [Galendromus occidentalis]|uniref:Insulin-degrading enzyme n=1 Tax=Galendromus occidentalis TaxID=34638 RepID=A0AAJ6QLY2_9ACAR|nr:insulin-degrading enzyme [Galendromus occidentalis]
MIALRALRSTRSIAFRRRTRWDKVAGSFLNHPSSSLAAKMASNISDQILSTHDVVKSESDQMLYRGLTLKNGLRVLLVSDSTTDKSAAALAVQVGSLTDPRNIPGLAHFCEHMLFLGTKKYPAENHYHAFLSNHGGALNAYTALDHTCYYFDVTPENFREASDIFAQFFLEPLFTQSCTDRELLAVDNEHQKNIKQDLWRMWRLQGATSDAEHDFSKFGTGSKETLHDIPLKEGIDVRQALLDFHSEYYSSNIMVVCLYGKETLEDLTEMAVTLFGGVKDKAIEAPSWPKHPFGEAQLRKQIKIVPVKDSRQMMVVFPMPDMRKEYRSSPSHYLSHLVGHEGEGSLLSYLKNKGWVNSLSGGEGSGARGFSFFTISMLISPEGLEHADEIVTAIFQYLELLRQEGPQQWIFEEVQKVGELHFRFKSKESPIRYASAITESMQLFDWKDTLSGAYIVQDYKPELIKELMTYLTPDKIRIGLVSQNFKGKTDLVEKYYHTEYCIEDIPDEKIEAWKKVSLNENLHLPRKNEFISTNLVLAQEEPEYTSNPNLLVSESSNRLWFMQDKEFKLPTSIAQFELRNPIVYESPLSVCLLSMAVTCFSDANNEYFYPATIAGLSYELNSSPKGVSIKVRGYSERQQALLEKVCERLVGFKIDPKRFEILKEALVRRLKNFRAEQPYQHAIYYSNMVLTEKYWSYEEQLAAMADCTVEKCDEFLGKFLQRVSVESLVYGNLRSEEAHNMSNAVRRILKIGELSFDETQNFREHRLNDGQVYEFNATNEVHPNNSVMTFYQVGALDTEDIHRIALNELLCQILEEPCYDVLRTQEQLGYIVTGGPRRSQGTYGIRIIVQSDKNPTFVSERIEEFVNGKLKKILTEMSDEEFGKHKKALIALKLEKPKRLTEKFAQMWGEISSRQYIFNRRQLEADEIGKLTKDEVIDFYTRHVAHGGSALKQMIVKIESESRPGDRTKGVKADYTIDDVTKFKATHPYIERPLHQPKL